MFKKSSLGLGTKLGAGISSNKSDLNSYLSSLKRKQKEVKKKHVKKNNEANDESTKEDNTEDDSDLASLAREFAKEEIQDSPFLKRKDSSDALRRASQSSLGTPLPEKEAPFVTSLVKEDNVVKASSKQTSSALNTFMKFNAKYASKTSLKNEAKESDTEPEPESEIHTSPLKIASELEEKIRPGSRRQSLARQKSLSESRKASLVVPPSPSPQQGGRLKQLADEKHLRLNLSGSRSRKPSAESTVPTASEMSEIPNPTPTPSPRSPIFNIEELHEIKELVEEEEPEVKKEEERREKEEEKRPEKETAKENVEDTKRPSVSPSSSSTLVEAKPRKAKKKKKKRRRSSSCSSASSSDVSCLECAKLCSFHRSKLTANPTMTTEKREESVQAGPANLERHYMFDPMQDMMFARTQRFASSAPMLSSPIEAALSEMMRNQLSMTEHFLQSQRRLYQSYCDSLQKASMQRQRVPRVHKRTSTNKARNERLHVESLSDMEDKQEDDKSYESDFESIQEEVAE